ncbi:MAG: type VI secretion system baseplate subunit TssK, partial [Nitrospinota bacterium]
MKPHHFQQRDRYMEDAVSFRFKSRHQFSWGVN